jgi:mannose-6-phosphate isomerase-like protein (cupin superfamily)
MHHQPLSEQQPHALRAGEGPIYWILGLPGQAKATGAQTAGMFSLVEALCPPGYATPLHIHYLEDEALYVLKGQLSVTIGGRTVAADAGSFVYQPRGIAHGFRVAGDVPARILCQTVPAGADHGQPGSSGQPRVLGPAALELETLADLASRYRIDVLGPLPEPLPAPTAGAAALLRGRHK